MSGELQFIAPDWAAPPGVRAAFTLRTGGVSRPPYESLNLGSRIGDLAEAVAGNRRRVREALRLPAEPVWLNQVHGVEVIDVPRWLHRSRDSGAGTEPSDLADPPTGDASVMRGAGQVCAIRVADCMPVLFAARDGTAVGAAHAGWRGLASGVLEATIRALGIPPGQLIAWMGPAIGAQHFEVGDEVREAFLAADGGAARAFVPNPRGRWQCDLYALAHRRLQAAGVSAISGGGWCTFAEKERFFSYRRDGQCGRMAALIWIDPR